MDLKYIEVSDLILKHKDHKEGLVRRTVISLIPSLASFDLPSFLSLHLNSCMSHLLSQVKKDRDKHYAFVSIGKVAIAVESHISPFLDSIIQNLRETLSFKG